jgi:hypothetical protein
MAGNLVGDGEVGSNTSFEYPTFPSRKANPRDENRALYKQKPPPPLPHSDQPIVCPRVQLVGQTIKAGSGGKRNEASEPEHWLINPTDCLATGDDNPGVSQIVGLNVLENVLFGYLGKRHAVYKETEPAGINW